VTKVCTRCNEPKPFELFIKRASSNDGLRGECKECSAAYHRAYRADRSEEQRAKDYAYSRAWKAANPDRVRQHDRTMYHKNSEREAAISKKWRDANKEWIKNYNAQYQAQNKDQIRVAKRAWRTDNRELRNQRERASYAANPEGRRKTHAIWREKNLEAQKAMATRRARGYRETMHDLYVKARLKSVLNIAGVEIPPELIEAKRQYLKIYRTLKETLK
jgi:hypothetical protein